MSFPLAGKVDAEGGRMGVAQDKARALVTNVGASS
jgi:hypothetical protein